MVLSHDRHNHTGARHRRNYAIRMVHVMVVLALALTNPPASSAQNRLDRLIELGWQEGASVALAEYQRTTAKPPKAEDLKLLADLADFLKNVGRRSDALQINKELILLQPKETKYQIALAEAYLVDARLESALRAYQDAAALLPTNSSADDPDLARLRRSVSRRIMYLEQAKLYEAYSGAYDADGPSYLQSTGEYASDDLIATRAHSCEGRVLMQVGFPSLIHTAA